MNFQRLFRIGLALAFKPARIIEVAASAARRTAVLVVCLLCAGVILLPALGCATAGLWIIVQANLGPMWAAFITAIALLIVSVLILLVGIIASRKRSSSGKQRKAERQVDAASQAAAAWPAAALAALPAPKDLATAGRGMFARHKGTALLTAAIVGLVMGQDLLRPRAGRKRARS